MSNAGRSAVCLIMLVVACAGSARADSGAGAISLTFNTSARAEAMGGAGTGLAWGTNTNHWANPALLAYRSGVNYMSFRSQLALGLADDVVISDRHLTVGAWGVTLMYAEDPLRGNFLDMGEHQGRDEYGNPTGTFESWMETASWGLGIDVVRLGEKLFAGDEHRYSRFASLAMGYVGKSFRDQLAPDDSLQDGSSGGSGNGHTGDVGLVVRATPLVIDGPDGLLDNGLVGLVAGAGWGTAHRNRTDEFIVHVDVDQSDPFPSAFDAGWSLHVELPLTDRASTDLGVLGKIIDPVLSWTRTKYKSEPGYEWDPTTGDYVYRHDKSRRRDEWGDGWEVGFLNVVYLRSGHVQAPYGSIDGSTEGWGLNFQYGRYGGVRYDYADVPQASGLPNVERESFSIWIDSLAF